MQTDNLIVIIILLLGVAAIVGFFIPRKFRTLVGFAGIISYICSLFIITRYLTFSLKDYIFSLGNVINEVGDGLIINLCISVAIFGLLLGLTIKSIVNLIRKKTNFSNTLVVLNEIILYILTGLALVATIFSFAALSSLDKLYIDFSIFQLSEVFNYITSLQSNIDSISNTLVALVAMLIMSVFVMILYIILDTKVYISNSKDYDVFVEKTEKNVNKNVNKNAEKAKDVKENKKDLTKASISTANTVSTNNIAEIDDNFMPEDYYVFDRKVRHTKRVKKISRRYDYKNGQLK